MSEKALCPKCDAYLSSIHRTGYCPNGCLGGWHAFEGPVWPDQWGGFCGAELTGVARGKVGQREVDVAFSVECMMRPDDRIHTLAAAQRVAVMGDEMGVPG